MGKLRRLLWFFKTHPLSFVGVLILMGFLILSGFASFWSPYDPTDVVAKPFQKPSAQHPLGTNNIGQDILSELIHGSRTSLLIGFVAAAIAILLGTLIGVIAALIWARPARVIRAQVLSLKHVTYIEAAEALGAGFWRVLLRHVVPGILSLALAQFILAASGSIFDRVFSGVFGFRRSLT